MDGMNIIAKTYVDLMEQDFDDDCDGEKMPLSRKDEINRKIHELQIRRQHRDSTGYEGGELSSEEQEIKRNLKSECD